MLRNNSLKSISAAFDDLAGFFQSLIQIFGLRAAGLGHISPPPTAAANGSGDLLNHVSGMIAVC